MFEFMVKDKDDDDDDDAAPCLHNTWFGTSVGIF
jgi:hypothetical protein